MELNAVKILLIEDNEVDAALFESIAAQIQQFSIKVTVCDDLSSALKILTSIKFDLIISDLDLPDASGMETIEKLATKAEETPILVLTGSEDDHFLVRATHLGVYDYLYKSDLNKRYLKRSIRYALSKFELNERHKKLESQLNHAQKMEAIGQLTGGIAHDFNNKLAIIQGNVELLPRSFSKGIYPEQQIESIRSCISQAAKLTSQLLAFSRKQEIQKMPVDMNDIVTRSIRLLERVVQRDIEISFEPTADLGKVEVDPTQMDQIIMNLVINARDAIDGPGEITVHTARVSVDEVMKQEQDFPSSGEYLCLSIADNGPGIPLENRKKIFEPFFTTKEVGQGTGLGLSVVHGIVEQHDGVLELESEPGQGTTFKIYFKFAEVPEIAAVEQIPVIGDISAHTVLYIEDEPDLRTMVADYMQSHGINVIEAEDGQIALAVFEKKSDEIDLVVSDVVMPRMTGREFFDHVRQSHTQLPFIFVSGYSRQEIMINGALPELTRFLHKPFGLEQLMADITAILGQKVDKLNISEAS